MSKRTCNNCDVDKCKGAVNAIAGCSNHQNIVGSVKFKQCITKVSFSKNTANRDALMPLLMPHM